MAGSMPLMGVAGQFNVPHAVRPAVVVGADGDGPLPVGTGLSRQSAARSGGGKVQLLVRKPRPHFERDIPVAKAESPAGWIRGVGMRAGPVARCRDLNRF